MIKTPYFWEKRTIISWLLWPISYVYYGLSVVKRLFSCQYISDKASVVCVGNATVGGAGKTPVCLALQSYIDDVAFITRGYKGKYKGPLWVLPEHTSTMVGDEAILLSRERPTVMGKNRKQSVQFAEGSCSYLIMDDGLQNTSVYKSLTFLVIDSHYGVGNGFLFPAGPLREPLSLSIEKSDALICVGSGEVPITYTKPIFRARPILSIPSSLSRDVVAFAGIAHPEKFKRSLEEAGINVKHFFSFPDHHPFSLKNMQDIVTVASQYPIVTTEKDYVRLLPKYKKKIIPIPYRLEFDKSIETFIQMCLP